MPEVLQEREREAQAPKVFGFDARVLLLLVAQFVAFVFGYGQLKGTVDAMHEQVQRMEVDIRAIRLQR